MAINSVTSNTSIQTLFPPHKADPVKPADAAGQAGQLVNAGQAQPQPVINAQGQTTGTLINTVA